jgi:O-antigen/teichoic acid export membrane protein
LITKRFIRNSIIYTIAGALPMASAIILLPFYYNYLSPSLYGSFALYSGFSLLIQVFVTYSFDTSVYTYFHEYKQDKDKLARFVSSAFTFILILGLLTGLVFMLVGSWVFSKVYSESKILFYPYGLISVVTAIFQAAFKVNSSLMQTQEKAVSFLWFNLLSFSLIAFFTVGGLLIFPNNLIGPIIGRSLAVTITGLWVLVIIYQQFGFHFDFPLIRSTFGFNQPVLAYQVIQWFNNYYDKVMMQFYLPVAQIGIYDFAYKCVSSIEFVLVGLYNSFTPKVLGMVALQTKKKATPEINRYYNGLTAVTILLVGLSIFAFPIILKWFNKPTWLAAIVWMPFIAVTYLLRSMRFYVAMPYAAIKYTKPLPYFYFIIVASKIVMMVILIPQYGVTGVIISTWAGYVIEVVMLYLGIRNRFDIQFNVFKLITAPLAMALLVVSIEPWLGTQHPLIVHSLYLLVGVILLIWAYRNELKAFQPLKLLK